MTDKEYDIDSDENFDKCKKSLIEAFESLPKIKNLRRILQ